jgi:hypothetical protein
MQQDLGRFQTEYAEQVYHHHASKQTGVMVPMLQTLFFYTIPVILLSVVAIWVIDQWINVPWKVAVVVPIVVGILTYLRMGKDRLKKWDHFFASIESRLNFDLNGNGKIDRIEPETFRLDLRGRDGKSAAWMETPRRMTRKKLQRFAYGIMKQGRKLTVSEWTEEPNKLFSQGDYDTLIAFMLDPERDPEKKEGWLRYKNRAHPNLGVELTDLGREVMGMFAEMENNPSPTLLGGKWE